jgi:hypothetical protein
VLPAYRYAPMDMHVVYASAKFLPRKVKAFVDHLAAGLSGIPGLN